MSGHPPFGAQVMLNGHEYVACQAQRAGIDFSKQDNCFTTIPNITNLAQVADTLSRNEIAGRLLQVCEGWIYATCLCFALDLEEQQRSTFHYQYSVFQILRGHRKTGQRWSLQNRPTESGLGLGCFTPPPPEEASLFSCANSVDRI
jgi:hypothetical protein